MVRAARQAALPTACDRGHRIPSLGRQREKLEAGASGYLAKPFVVGTLRTIGSGQPWPFCVGKLRTHEEHPSRSYFRLSPGQSGKRWEALTRAGRQAMGHAAKARQQERKARGGLA